MGNNVRWRGMSAEYSPVERQIMSTLPVKEQAFVHTLKALLDGEIQAGREPHTEVAQPVTGGDDQGQLIPPTSVYTDPEDLEFGKPKKKRPVYALSWTWRQGKVYKTKVKAQAKMKAWKKWYERQGWKVISIPGQSGYFAAKGNERHSIALHEYEKETLVRIR